MKRFNVVVNGKAYDVAVEELGAGAAPVAAAPAAPVAAAPAPATSPATPAPLAAPAAVGEGAMPGTILEVKVAVGDTVKAGQPVVVLEAMKMENDIVAPVDGKVTSIVVKKGDAVNSGDIMATIA